MSINISDMGTVIGIIAACVVVILIFARGFSQNSKLHGSGKDAPKSGSTTTTTTTTTDSSKKQ